VTGSFIFLTSRQERLTSFLTALETIFFRTGTNKKSLHSWQSAVSPFHLNLCFSFFYQIIGVPFPFFCTSGSCKAGILVNPGIPEKAIRNNAGMVPRENLEESVVRTGRDFPAGGNPCLS
jgi:hypothetical protein